MSCKLTKQASKPQNCASSKLLPTGVQCRATSIAKKSFFCPFVKVCHRFPYEEPSKAEESDAEEQRNGVDVEQAVQAQGQPVSFISYTRIALFIRLLVTFFTSSNA